MVWERKDGIVERARKRARGGGGGGEGRSGGEGENRYNILGWRVKFGIVL